MPTSFSQVLQAYKEYEENGWGFYNLPAIQFFADEKKINQNELSQHRTKAPYSIKLHSNGVQVKGIRKSPHVEYIDELLGVKSKISGLAEETFELLQSVTTIPSLQTALVAMVISLIALLLSVFGLVMSVILTAIR